MARSELGFPGYRVLRLKFAPLRGTRQVRRRRERAKRSANAMSRPFERSRRRPGAHLADLGRTSPAGFRSCWPHRSADRGFDRRPSICCRISANCDLVGWHPRARFWLLADFARWGAVCLVMARSGSSSPCLATSALGRKADLRSQRPLFRRLRPLRP